MAVYTFRSIPETFTVDELKNLSGSSITKIQAFIVWYDQLIEELYKQLETNTNG